MKKNILLAIMTLTLNVFAQSKQLSSNYLKNNDDKTRIMNKINSDGNNIISTHEQNRTPSFLFQKPDSIREWSWDSNISSWINDNKTVDMTYDANKNLTNQREQIWNETFWENTFKTEMQYDGYKPTTTFKQKWTDNKWENYMQSGTYYNANNQIDSSKTEMWMGGAWSSVSLFSFTYDLNNRTETILIESNFGPYTYKTKVTYSYDSNNNRKTEYNETWTLNNWVNDSWIDYTYDAQNNIKSEIEKKWVINNWQNSKKQTYEYDNDGNTLNETYLTWNGITWMNSKQFVSSYNQQNLQTSEMYQTWNGVTWVDDWKYITDYEGNNVKSETYQEWNGSILANKRKTNYTYIGQDFISKEVDQTWNGTTWINESQLLSIYDVNYNLLKEIDQNWNGSDWINSSTTINTYNINNILISESDKYWDIDGITAISGDSTRYYFSESSVAIKETMTVNISLFPNPTAGSLKIISSSNITGIEISNMLGEMIFSNFGTNNFSREIDVSNYAKGIYVVKIKTATETVNRKIIVR